MNERIRELAVQAGIDLYGLTGVEATQANLQEFAELIVRECADIALREEHDPYECIKKHFGIE